MINVIGSKQCLKPQKGFSFIIRNNPYLISLNRTILEIQCTKLCAVASAQYTATIQYGAVVPTKKLDGRQKESLGEFVWRWLDVTGFLSRWTNRKQWVMDLDPYSRMGTIMITEFERKLLMFMGFNAYLFYIISMGAWWYAQNHFAAKPPCPKAPDYPHLDGRKKDFTWHGSFYFMEPKQRCKHCRWLDSECKRRCFDELQTQGHVFKLHGGKPLSAPRQIIESPDRL